MRQNEGEGKHYRQIVAKYENKAEERWLPLWIHLRDTADIMKKLMNKWVPDSVINGSGLDRETFTRVATFLAASHDCGKATSYFQSIISIHSGELFDKLNSSGMLVKREYLNKGKTPHALAGQCILQSRLAGCELDESLANVVGAHHGRPAERIEDLELIETYPNNFYGDAKDNNQRNIWERIWKEIIEDAMEFSGVRDIVELPKINTDAQVLLSGLLIVADWLASDTRCFPLIALEEYVDESIYPSRANNGWKKHNYPELWESEINVMDDQSFFDRFGFLPNEVQSAVFEVVNNCMEPGVFILEAQMGCGKTEAALAAAEIMANRKDCSGIFFALPTQATSNGIYPRLYEWAEHVSEDTKNAITLAHSGAEFYEEYQQQREEGRVLVDDIDCPDGELTVHPWFQGNKKALLANFVIGTVDQFLMGALRKKHFMLRHLGLAGKIVVIDECHAYDAFMNVYLDRMLEWMASYKVPVILLSATLPERRRRELIAAYVRMRPEKIEQENKDEYPQYPLLTWTDGKKVHSKVIEQRKINKSVRVIFIDAGNDLIRILDEKLSDGGCACIIANTVKRAQQYYDRIDKEMQGADIILYHAQYLMPDRAKKEKELLKKMGKNSLDKDRRRLVLIGTQVLEQSLDYDADIMFTELCPMDLFFQRIGRLHRHDRYDMINGRSRTDKLCVPQCYILMNKLETGEFVCDGGSRAIYGDYLLVKTRKVLNNILPDVLNIPADIPKLVQAVYCEEDDSGIGKNAEYLEMWEEYQRTRGEKVAKAKTYCLKKPKWGLMGILQNAESFCSDGERAVRDAGTMIEVILLKDADKANACFLDQGPDKGELIPKKVVPENKMAEKIMRQRIRLPQIFSTRWMINRTIDELEKRQNGIAEWQKSSWLSGELILMLDENDETELNGYRLHYDFSKGLVYERQGDDNNNG